MTQNQARKACHGVVQGKVGRQVLELAHLVAEVRQEIPVELGVPFQPGPGIGEWDRNQADIIQRDRCHFVWLVVQQRDHINTVSRPKQEQGDTAAGLRVDAGHLDAAIDQQVQALLEQGRVQLDAAPPAVTPEHPEHIVHQVFRQPPEQG